MKIEDGDVEVTVQRLQSDDVLLDTADGGSNLVFNPLEAVKLGKALIAAGVECLAFREVNPIIEDLRRFIDGGPVDENGNILELSAFHRLGKLTVTFIGDKGVRLSDGRWIDIGGKQ